MSKKTGTFTEKQLARLPEAGYWVMRFEPQDSNYRSYVIYCIMNGEVKYIRRDSSNGTMNLRNPNEWSTLLWSCMPTKNMIERDNGDGTHTYIHFKTIEEAAESFGDKLPNGFDKKAPNDF